MKTYKGLNYIIKRNLNLGFPLAYVKLPKNHPWKRKKNYWNIPLEVHGSLTFMARVKTKEDAGWQGFDKGTWIGWDYGHAGDYVDYGDGTGFSALGERHWSDVEVEEEIKSAIRKILRAR